MDLAVKTVASAPFAEQCPGTSGLRKSTATFLQQHYTENFIQATFNTLAGRIALGDCALVVGGDGRYHNGHVLRSCLLPMAAANGIIHVIVGKDGILSTPAASHIIRKFGACGGIILTASHNPGGINNDFGIKFNAENGGPSPERITNEIYLETQNINSYKTLSNSLNINLSKVHSEIYEIEDLPNHFKVTVIDPVESYCKYLMKIFDFQSIINVTTGADGLQPFKVVADCMNGVMGPYAVHILGDKLKVPKENIIRCQPLEDFGGLHPDPNLTYANDLLQIMIGSDYDMGCAFDGDGDRNMILGNDGFFINPSDALAVIADNAKLIPYFKRKGIQGLARSMPTSCALDRVAQKHGIPFYEVPTGWKFFGNLMDSNKLSLCGEESFGMGSNHIREKDGLWAVIAWLSVIASIRQTQKEIITIPYLVEKHWLKYGRNYYTRYDYEHCEVAHSVEIMTILNELISNKFTVGSVYKLNDREYKISICDNFSFRDAVDERVADNQGVRVIFEDGSRIIYRLSGTGSSGATIRMYVECYESDPCKIKNLPSEKLKPLINMALNLSKIEQITGRGTPTVIT